MSEIEDGMRELFKYAFITNCHLDQNDVTEAEIHAVDTLDSFCLLEGLKELMVALLKSKKAHLKSLNFEKISQKLEIDLKNSQKNEKLLKTRVETYKKRIEELEEKHAEDLKKIEEIHKKERVSQIKPNKRVLSLNLNSFSEKSGQIEKDFNAKNEIFEAPKSTSQIGIDFIKKRLEEKSAEIAKIQEKIREKINSRSPSPMLGKNLEKNEGFYQGTYKKPLAVHMRSVSVQQY